MECSIRFHNGVGVITLEGRLDSPAAPLFYDWFMEQDKAECNAYVLDMEKVPYLTSLGLRSLLQIWKRLQARNGKILFCSWCAPVQELLKMVGFTDFLTPYNSVDEALAALA